MNENFALIYGAEQGEAITHNNSSSSHSPCVHEKIISLYKVVTPMVLLTLIPKLFKAVGTTNRTRFLGVGRCRWLLGFSFYYIPPIEEGSHAREGVFVLIATIRKGSFTIPSHLTKPRWRRMKDRLYRKSNYHSILKGFRREPIADTGKTYDVSGHHIPFKD